MFTFARNRCSRSVGIGVHVQSEYASGGGGGGGAPPPLPVEPEPEEEEDVQEEEEMEELELDLKDLIINSEGCSIASADSNDSGFDLLLMVLVVLIPVWWRDQA